MLRTCHSCTFSCKYENMLIGKSLGGGYGSICGVKVRYDAGLAVSGFKNGAFTYLVVLLGRIIGPSLGCPLSTRGNKTHGKRRLTSTQ